MADHSTPGGDRLNKYLALQLGISRREADTYIERGRVAINGTVAVLGARIIPGDAITVDGKPVEESARLIYIALNKPTGYVSSRRAQGDLPTIYNLLPTEYHALKPVGRLDQNSSGLLLLTNDGDFAYRMTHPKFHKIKIYEVQLDRPLEPLHQQMISDYGIQLEDGRSQFLIERIEPFDASFSETSATHTSSDSGKTAKHEGVARALGGGAENANSLRVEAEGRAPTYIITMSEGRNRQIRRTFKALGYTVTYLHRVQFGPFALGGLAPGDYRQVSAKGA